MERIFATVITLFTVAVNAAYVPDDCLHCICYVETHCSMPQHGSGQYSHCDWDVYSYSCGPYQIKDIYWEDAKLKGGSLMGDWLKCTADWQCSGDAVNGYMKRYATKARIGTTPTCEHFSRIHNGGPNGYKVEATKKYWLKVKDCLDHHKCCDPYPPRRGALRGAALLESILKHKSHNQL
ncbi:lysozyme-like [Ptychodera flava]|uniref:lysozyme-like n=1 Tax=Ptychodera flava TaxID=63121 RepID=UPI00396A6387